MPCLGTRWRLLVYWTGILSASMMSGLPALADTYRGALICTEVAGSQPTTSMRMTVHVKGSKLTYNHEVFDPERILQGLAEIGSGTVSGSMLHMTGKTASPGLQITAAFNGQLQNNVLQLNGQETWMHYVRGLHFTWPCRASLPRVD